MNLSNSLRRAPRDTHSQDSNADEGEQSTGHTTYSLSHSSSKPQRRARHHTSSSNSSETARSPPKKSRHSRTGWRSTSADNALRRAQRGSPSRSPQSRSREKALSPLHFSSHTAASTMLNRAERSGGALTVKLTRGSPGSPTSPCSSPHPTKRQSSDPVNDRWSKGEDETPRDIGVGVMQSVGLAEYLQQDDRPVFVVDLRDESNFREQRLNTVFANTALKSRPELLNYVRGINTPSESLGWLGPPFEDFKAWILSSLDASQIVPSFPFAGIEWKITVARNRLKIVSSQSALSELPIRKTRSSDILRQRAGSDSNSASPLTAQVIPDSTGYFDIKTPLAGRQPNIFNIIGPRDGSQASIEFPRVDSNMSPSNEYRGHPNLISAPLSGGEQPWRGSSKSEGEQDVQPTQLLPHSPLPDKASFDWTRIPLSSDLPEHIRFIRDINWAATSLGPVSEWNSDLRSMCNLIMASPHPSAMYWGTSTLRSTTSLASCSPISSIPR